MAAHYVSLNLGEDGFQFSDYTVNTSPAAGVSNIELRVDDSVFRRMDVQKALDAFERFFQNPQFYNNFGTPFALLD